MADGHVAHQGADDVGVEHLSHQTLLTDGHDPSAPSRSGYPRGLLAAVLEGEEREVGESGHIPPGGEDAKDSALIARPITVIVQRRHSAVLGGALVPRLAVAPTRNCSGRPA